MEAIANSPGVARAGKGRSAERAPGGAELELEELVSLAAEDSLFYSQYFFPKTVRQRSPEFHRVMWAVLEGSGGLLLPDGTLVPEIPPRYCAFEVFRGGAKTSIFRLFASKRIAYAISRTMLFVGKSQDQARRSVEWLMTQVEYNRPWADTFGLRKGKKWTSEEIEIYHGADDVPIRVIALGITGSTRGINVDDYRPDFILVDDPCDEENTATPDQREKTADFFFGSLQNSLAPASESPHAMMGLAQTLLHPEDLISLCRKDPLWRSAVFPIFREDGSSQWPERWSRDELLREKEGFAARGKLPLWMREMECKIIASELAAFPATALQYWEVLPSQEDLTCYLAIDPVPPPSDRELSKGLRGKDWECLAVIARWDDVRRGESRYFLAEYAVNRGHDPDWTVIKFFELADRWNVRLAHVESIAYQRTLKWLIEKAMQTRRRYVPLFEDKNDKRKKSYRIIDNIGAVVQHRQLYVHKSQSEFIEQYLAYPNVAHDDVIEAVGNALHLAHTHGGVYGGSMENLLAAEASIPDEPYFGACP